ncbi:MAG TPA: hypothetical protein VGL83_01200 [Stellaceae bacterium]|jgi:hypothetical protein
MKTRPVLIALVAALGLVGARPEIGRLLVTSAYAACDPGTPIDKTTVEEVRDRLIKAGYQNPLHLRKGCDNVWHGTVTKNGGEVSVAALPDGHIVIEGD